MKDIKEVSPRYRLQRYLIVGYALFIVYVSLSPFIGWQEQGLYFIDMLTAPLAQTFTWFDAILNFFSYMPLGFLLAYTLRRHWTWVYVVLSATLAGLLLTVTMEYAQLYLPSRVSSNSDLLSNSTGAFCGAVFALIISEYTWFTSVESWHDKWFHRKKFSDFGLALVVLWMFAQTNPSLPMLGSVFVGEIARWPFDIVHAAPFNWLESAGVTLNLLLLGILLSTLLRERQHTVYAMLVVLCVVTLVKFIAAALLLKSWALLMWMNSEAMLGIIAGLLLLMSSMRLPYNWLNGFGAMVAILYLVHVQDLLFGSPSSAVMRLYHWHYLHMLNYNGLSKFVIFLFPLLMLGYLLVVRSARTVKN